MQFNFDSWEALKVVFTAIVVPLVAIVRKRDVADVKSAREAGTDAMAQARKVGHDLNDFKHEVALGYVKEARFTNLETDMKEEFRTLRTEIGDNHRQVIDLLSAADAAPRRPTPRRRSSPSGRKKRRAA